MKRKKTTVISLLLAAALILLASCGGNKTADVNLNNVLDQITAAVKLPDGMKEMTMDDLTSLYGIDSGDIVQFAGYYTDVGTLADEIVMVEATNSGTAKAVQQKVQDRYNAKLAQMKDYLPDEYQKISGCKVLTDGNYIAMFISGDTAAMQKVYEADLKG